ncbi:unnamed protein product [Amoebophrya sp. A120]|nr:unnamed protein product [Amoebophrya sp. A120]|eukprot:GSA120T00015017001.1
MSLGIFVFLTFKFIGHGSRALEKKNLAKTETILDFRPTCTFQEILYLKTFQEILYLKRSTTPNSLLKDRAIYRPTCTFQEILYLKR